MTTSSMPALSASSTISRMAGLAMPSRSTTGKSSFLVALVAGNSRVPKPAAGMTALRTFGPVRERQREPGQAEVALEDLHDRLLIARAARDELRRAVALRADALAAPDVRLERLVRQHAVQHGRGQLLRAGRARRSGRRTPAPRSSACRAARRLPASSAALASPTIRLLIGPRQLLHAALDLALGERIAAD